MLYNRFISPNAYSVVNAVRALYVLIVVQLCLCLTCAQVRAQDAEAAIIHDVNLNDHPELTQLSAEERKWFRIFQEGNFLADGWQAITRKILASTPEAERAQRRIALEQLGYKIGLEWSRSNDIRRIDTRMLQEWGGRLKKVARQNPEQIPDLIASINQELDEILD